MDCFRNSLGPVKLCLLDSGIDKRNHTNSHRDASMGRNPTDPSILVRLCRLRSSLAKGQVQDLLLSLVDGSRDGRWRHDESQHHHSHEERTDAHNVR